MNVFQVTLYLMTVVLLPVLSTTDVRGDVIFDNFAPGDLYGEAGFALGDITGMDDPQELAMQFVVPEDQDYVLDTVEIAARWVLGANELKLVVYSSLEGTGTSIGSSTVFDQVPLQQGIHTPPVEVGGFDNVLLEAGETYWIAATMPNGGGLWFWNSIEDAGPIAVRHLSDPEWEVVPKFPRSAMRVNAIGTTIPEPSSLVVLGLAGIAGTIFRRRSF